MMGVETKISPGPNFDFGHIILLLLCRFDLSHFFNLIINYEENLFVKTI
jgi:hypothetical protein